MASTQEIILEVLSSVMMKLPAALETYFESPAGVRQLTRAVRMTQVDHRGRPLMDMVADLQFTVGQLRQILTDTTMRQQEGMATIALGRPKYVPRDERLGPVAEVVAEAAAMRKQAEAKWMAEKAAADAERDAVEAYEAVVAAMDASDKVMETPKPDEVQQRAKARPKQKVTRGGSVEAEQPGGEGGRAARAETAAGKRPVVDTASRGDDPPAKKKKVVATANEVATEEVEVVEGEKSKERTDKEKEKEQEKAAKKAAVAAEEMAQKKRDATRKSREKKKAEHMKEMSKMIQEALAQAGVIKLQKKSVAAEEEDDED
jgi:hypothetical protein